MKLNTRNGVTFLSNYIQSLPKKLIVTDGLIAYPYHWQVPAATEKASFESLASSDDVLNFIYVAFPWATLIDGLRNDASVAWELLRVLESICMLSGKGPNGRCATVAQHIHADKFIDVYRACGVTDLFWSHATAAQRELSGVAIHGFPLFPAQTPNGPEWETGVRPRRFLANFIGAYNPKLYLSDVRQHIFNDAGSKEDLLIVKRSAWHFNRAVYSEQMKGIAPDDTRLAMEKQHKEEYIQAIRDSFFTLCPTGSGPNSIRIGEALALGSIPIILTRDLCLPGNRSLWEAACLFEDDSVEGYRRALARARTMPAAELQARQAAGVELYAAIGPHAYRNLLLSAMQ